MIVKCVVSWEMWGYSHDSWALAPQPTWGDPRPIFFASAAEKNPPILPFTTTTSLLAADVAMYALQRAHRAASVPLCGLCGVFQTANNVPPPSLNVYDPYIEPHRYTTKFLKDLLLYKMVCVIFENVFRLTSKAEGCVVPLGVHPSPTATCSVHTSASFYFCIWQSRILNILFFFYLFICLFIFQLLFLHLSIYLYM